MPDNNEKITDNGGDNPDLDIKNQKAMSSGRKNENRPKKSRYFFLALFFFLAVVVILFIGNYWGRIFSQPFPGSFIFQKKDITPGSSFFGWDISGNTLEESGEMSQSKSRNWWLNSGGLVTAREDIIATNEGSLDKNNKWRKLYSKNNPGDTDNGYHPQNIFRLVARTKRQDVDQQVFFMIDGLNLSDSKQRNESNGVLLFNRYQDGDNLYYAGLRVDGQAVIKKKIEDKYYTMVEKDVFANGRKYDKKDNPNFLPLHKWLGIKSEVRNIDNSIVDIKLYLSREDGSWQPVLEAQDKGGKYGDAPIFTSGYAGIRTDFMDVSFKNYNVGENK